MATEQPATETPFADVVLVHWEDAMDRFFDHVEHKMLIRKLTVEQVRKALVVGYGDEVGDAWAEWAADL